MLPWTLPNLVVVYNWTWIFNSSVGVANYLLKTFKIIDSKNKQIQKRICNLKIDK